MNEQHFLVNSIFRFSFFIVNTLTYLKVQVSIIITNRDFPKVVFKKKNCYFKLLHQRGHVWSLIVLRLISLSTRSTCFTTRSTRFSTRSTRFSTRITHLSIRFSIRGTQMFTCSTRLFTRGTRLSTRSICLPTCSTRSTIYRSFYS